MTVSAPERRKVIVDSWAWMSKGDLTPDRQEEIRRLLTLIPETGPGFRGEDGEIEEPKPLPLYVENDAWIGLAREYFLARRRPHHDIELRCTVGNKQWWPGPFQWNPAITPRPQQREAVDTVLKLFRSGELGGLVLGKPGFGKTLLSLLLAYELQLPTLIVVHKEFLAEQWLERIHGNPKKDAPAALLGAKVGFAQEDRCEYQGNHIVIGMVHSLAKRAYPREFYSWPGLVIFDECHRVGARTWSVVPGKFLSRFRFGVTATPRRKDKCERVFLDHIGPIRYTATEQRLSFQVRRVWTEYQPPKGRAVAGLAGKAMLMTYLCANLARNKVIVGQLILACRAGRKVIVLSERLDHLDRLRNLLLELWPTDAGPPPTTGPYVGGMTAEEREVSESKQVILATYQYASEGLDIPPLDTAFLVTPYSDVEQAVGRIRRPHKGKKPALVVDFRDDHVSMFANSAEKRDKFYRSEAPKKP